jgi:anhydro-N-acetylmuramic acid kinase
VQEWILACEGRSVSSSQRLCRVIAKTSRRIIGLMSGMSMDGVNLACADISGEFPTVRLVPRGSHYRAYDPVLRERLYAGQRGSARDVSVLNVLVAREFAACVAEFLERSTLDCGSVDAIGSHGQTLYHSTGAEAEVPSTLQVGSPSLIAELTGLITVGNFRIRDIAACGHGAPLVSIADVALFRDPEEPVAVNNLGSISNVTVVTPYLCDVIAFDTGPANMVIDYFARATLGSSDTIDRDGMVSARGECVDALLKRLLDMPFFSREPPKAAGYDEFGPHVVAEIAKPFMHNRPADLIRTAVEYAGVTIGDAYRRFVLPRFPGLRRVLLSGGGVRNATLVARIRHHLPSLVVEALPEPLQDDKEAIAFALLAHETLSGRAGNLPQVTGARHQAVLGEIAS